jgi:DegV family protein with EDD domain
MAVAIVTDTTHYLPASVVAGNDLHEVSLYVSEDGTAVRESELGDLGAFYARLRDARELPRTSQPSVGDFLAVYEPLLEAGHEILSIHLSAGISGTCDAARQAAASLGERGLGDRIAVLDSATACGGLGFVVLAAAARARTGAPLAEVLEHAGAARDRQRIWFCIDTLEYLQRGGRVGRAQAWIGGALKIKPILSIESEITPVERVRTAGRAFERMVQFARELHEQGADGWAVQHIQAAEQADRLQERCREVFGSEPLFVGEVGAVIGAHTGPGLIGVGAVPRDLV